MQAVFNVADSVELCILSGTQMLAKGHHVANVTLVAVLDADSGRFSPDFRSHERMGQLLTQVAGRSGLGDLPGKVVVQTHQPQHPLLEVLINKGYGFFAQQLMSERRITQLPPFRHMALIRAESDRACLCSAALYVYSLVGCTALARAFIPNCHSRTPIH